MKFLILGIFLTLFSGCDILDSQEFKEKKLQQERILFEKKSQLNKEIELQKIAAQTQKELALLASKKELAKIEKTQELEKIKLQAQLEKQRVILEQKNAKILFEQKLQEYKHDDALEVKRYYLFLASLLITLTAFFIFYHFKKKREDKLLAYNDNLKKYFHQKENEARVQIAEKMLDTIASGKLDKEQENQLISAFKGENYKEERQPQLSSQSTENIEDIEVIELQEKT